MIHLISNLENSSINLQIMKNKYQVVVIENPCLAWDDMHVKDFFVKIAKLKIEGFQYEYGLNVMPLNAHDFFATHVVLCEVDNGELTPISAMKISKYSVCNFFAHSFPPMDLALQGGNSALAKEIEDIVKQITQQGKEITYDASWTTRPDIRNSNLINRISRIVFALWINYHLFNSIPNLIVSATLKVKTDKIFYATGCVPISKDPYYKLIEVDNQDAMMFSCNRFSDMILRNAERYQDLWDNRIEYGNPIPQIQNYETYISRERTL